MRPPQSTCAMPCPEGSPEAVRSALYRVDGDTLSTGAAPAGLSRTQQQPPTHDARGEKELRKGLVADLSEKNAAAPASRRAVADLGITHLTTAADGPMDLEIKA